MPPAQRIDTSEARYQMPVGFIDEEVEHAPQGIHGGIITVDAFVVSERCWPYGARGLREIRNDKVEHAAEEMDRKGGAATIDAFVIRGCSWLYEAARRLREIRNLESNWDSYGSRPLSDDAFNSAKEVLFAMECDTPPPAIVPVSGGGVQFEWQVEDRELEIEFLPDSRIIFLRVHEDEATDEEELSSTDLTRVPSLLKWLTKSKQAERDQAIFD